MGLFLDFSTSISMILLHKKYKKKKVKKYNLHSLCEETTLSEIFVISEKSVDEVSISFSISTKS